MRNLAVVPQSAQSPAASAPSGPRLAAQSLPAMRAQPAVLHASPELLREDLLVVRRPRALEPGGALHIPASAAVVTAAAGVVIAALSRIM